MHVADLDIIARERMHMQLLSSVTVTLDILNALKPYR